jgi:hypothetical protein
MSRESSIADTDQIKESIGKIAFAVTYLGQEEDFGLLLNGKPNCLCIPRESIHWRRLRSPNN